MSVARLLGQVGQETSDLISKVFGSLDDVGKENIHNIIRQRFGEVVPTEGALQAMSGNLQASGKVAADITEEELFAGIKGASEYRGNILTEAFNTDKGMMGGFMAPIGGAAIGMVGASAVGGDSREGAAIGALAGLGAASAGRAVMKNLGSVEENFMNSLFKGQTVTRGGEDIIGTIDDLATKANKPVDQLTPDDLINMGYGSKPMEELYGTSNIFKNLDDYKSNPASAGGDVPFSSKEIDLMRNNAQFNMGKTPKVEVPLAQDLMAPTTDAGRRARFLENLSSEQLKKAGFGAEYKRDVMLGRRDLNVSQATRIAGFTGSALSGMAFSSRRRDHRRGFNKRRGNRV